MDRGNRSTYNALRSWDRANVVLAGGCFDIFHIGHLEYLSGSKELGDILLVGINSDASYYRAKGRKPVFSQTERQQVISALRMVDEVFIFDDDHIGNAIRAIRPAVFAKGIDYADKPLPQEEVMAVQYVGGRIAYVGKSKRSSSSILREKFVH